ncbi:MAG: hypothetical protein NTU62_02190 [Spirochaetes bacterium]|nr:hypothetical protein [Spirochaetota bacterium]
MRLRTFPLLLALAAASAAAQVAGPAASELTGEEQLAARITGIAAAAADGSAIEVTFVSSDPRRDLLVFWGTAPMTTAEGLLRSTAKAQLDAGAVRYAVPVLPGTDYWFAVLDAGLYKVGGVPLVPGENTTARGVRVPAAAASSPVAASTQRNQPLPSLQLGVSVSTGREVETGGLPEVPTERGVSPTTALAIAELLREAGPVPRPILKVQVLSEDVAGGDQVLQSVASGALASGDWAGAEKKLKDFLSLRRTPELRALARFYLGQAYWFQGRLREAFFEFLGCEDTLPRESRAWQDACLGGLAARS